MADVTEVKLGVATLTYNSVALGHTKGGVEMTYTPDIKETSVDQYGSTPVAASIIGERLEVKVTLAESSLAEMNKAIAGGTLVTGATKDEINVGSDGATSLTGQELVIHPTAEGASTDKDVTVHKAVVIGAVVLPYKTEEETLFEITFLALIDEAKATGEKLFRIGLSD